MFRGNVLFLITLQLLNFNDKHCLWPVSYTHLDGGACMVMQMAYHEDRAQKTADIAPGKEEQNSSEHVQAITVDFLADGWTCLLYTSRCV